MVQLWQSAWERQPEATAESSWRQAAQARRATADSLTSGPMALELSGKTDRFTDRDGAREYEVGVAIPLWLPGERSSAARWADAESLALTGRIQAAKLRTAGQVRQAWWSWQRAVAELTAARDQQGNATKLAADVARRVRAGDLAQADRNQADGAVALARTVLAQAQAQEESERQALLAMIGSDSLAVPPVLAVEELSLLGSAIGASSAVQTVPEEHPLLQELQSKAQAARRQAERVAVQKRDNPELTLSTTRDRGARGEHYGQTITVGVRIPFGSGSRHTEQWASANAVALEADSELVVQRSRLLADIRTAQARARAAQTQLEAAAERQRLAQQTRGFYQKSFALGETDMPTRLRIEQEATDAERQALLARVELASAVSLFLQAQGVLPEQTPAIQQSPNVR
ncbi:TolC family protein [Raoultella planticola]|nr:MULTISPECIES: TolC family protein [Gammaproteobacteria]MCD9354727.1 TolC family protein [Klebsiella pneumoniae]MCD9415401.1 TolC family protein [Klebsiella pneumoniae]MCD9608987.1 TolC family protein [Raoultella planticola]MDE9664879.1 TolC family protein [Citrobacter portucalensis]MDE9674519.1 TolC family protein [Citrobacter portucalensis]